MLKIHTLVFNPWQENTYVIAADNGDCIIVDPGCFSEGENSNLKSYLETHGLTPVRLLNTHLHLDHVFGNRYVCEAFNLGAEAHKGDEFFIEQTTSYATQFGVSISENPPALKAYLEDGQVITLGDSEIHVLHIPGHSPGGVVLYCPNEKKAIVGDVIFRESIGRTDLALGNHEDLINGIKTKLLPLDDEVVLYPGHGPSTTVGHERAYNGFLQ